MRAIITGRAAAALAAAAVAVSRVCGAAAETPAPGPGAAALPAVDAATSLLVVAPHPDDEILCCAGLMQQVLHAGGRASVVWITSGDAEWLALLLIEHIYLGGAARARELGERRMAEARAATALLGVPPGGQLFLGYPDGGVPALLTDNRTMRYRSPTTAATTVPYPDALFPGHPYTGESLERDLAAVLERVQPTLILAPSPLDTHPDHRAAGLLTMAVSARRAGNTQIRYWIVHGGEGWPGPRELSPGLPLTPAPVSRGLASIACALTPAEEDQKLLALRAHATQMRLMAPFLLAFVRTTEILFLQPEPPPPSLPPAH